MRSFVTVLGMTLALAMHTNALADNLYSPSSWSALAGDRRAAQVGDGLTILIYENASAKDAAGSGSKKSNALNGRVNAGSFDKSAGFGLSGSSDNQGTTDRSGGMVAQISATVDEVLPNGDLRISGAQLIRLNGNHTTIKVKGRVRPADISPSNIVLSTRLADAQIDYDGKGFVSRSGKPGIITRIFNFLGLM
jgi:flagellar L-ring protein precursor FlgH